MALQDVLMVQIKCGVLYGLIQQEEELTPSPALKGLILLVCSCPQSACAVRVTVLGAVCV